MNWRCLAVRLNSGLIQCFSQAVVRVDRKGPSLSLGRAISEKKRNLPGAKNVLVRVEISIVGVRPLRTALLGVAVYPLWAESRKGTPVLICML